MTHVYHLLWCPRCLWKPFSELGTFWSWIEESSWDLLCRTALAESPARRLGEAPPACWLTVEFDLGSGADHPSLLWAETEGWTLAFSLETRLLLYLQRARHLSLICCLWARTDEPYKPGRMSLISRLKIETPAPWMSSLKPHPIWEISISLTS